MISARELTKQYGDQLAVDHVTFTLEPGRVTGFLGPNGAGKSTTMRLILGLDHPTSGTVTVSGQAYRDLPAPMREVGALLEAQAVDGKRSARRHLDWLARAGGLPRSRVDEVLAMVGLTDAADKQVGGFSLGMSQRLGMATAMLGDPPTLLFDEPMNGLDPEGIRWVRTFLRALADQGRTVVVSSHLMSEVEAMADHVLVIGRGRIIADSSVAAFTAQGSGASVRVVSPQPDHLRELLDAAGATATVAPDGALVVVGLDNVAVADLAAEADIRLHELTPQRATLEAAFMEVTYDAVEYRSADDHAGRPNEEVAR